jgi:hypothetical protein
MEAGVGQLRQYRPAERGIRRARSAASSTDCPIAWLGLVHVLLPLWNDRRWAWWLSAGYVTATVLFAALPSFQDIRLRARSLALYIVIGAFVWWAYAHM